MDEKMIEQKLYVCPMDPKPFDPACPTIINPGGPVVNSYMVNGYFVWGLKESAVRSASSTIYLAERRAEVVDNEPPYCDDIYHPWFNPTNLVAPANEMDARVGAISTLRHSQGSVYVFADTHAGWKVFAQTWDFARGLDRHNPNVD
jgi:hypothetical protein